MNKERTMLSVPEGSVKRYAVFSVPPVIEEYRDGYFVNYEDYEVLKKKADALESEVHSLSAQLNFDVENDFTAENARLKAEVERSTTQYNSIIDHQLAVIEGKQAEIDRLNSELFTCSCANANMNKHMNENASLKAEVETIRKDRDALFASHKTALADIQRLHWQLQAAKEGKQS